MRFIIGYQGLAHIAQTDNTAITARRELIRSIRVFNCCMETP